MQFSPPSRRRFLHVVAGGTAGAVWAGCGGNEAAAPASGPVKAGNVKDLPASTLKPIVGAPVAIGRDDKGVYALTLVCTHEHCDISVQGSVSFGGVTCNCHGSQFDANGAVKKGPATKALDHYKVDIDAAGEMTIQAGTVVDAAARTAVPA